MKDIVELVEAFALAAVARAEMEVDFERIVHVGEPCRYITFSPNDGELMLFVLNNGDAIRVNRGLRLLIEPVDRVTFRPAAAVVRWVTQ